MVSQIAEGATTRWQCDVCNFVSFHLHASAQAHEERCQVATVELGHQEGRRHGLNLSSQATISVYGENPVVLAKWSTLFFFVELIQQQASVLFLPERGHNNWPVWENMGDADLDRVVNTGRKYLPALEEGRVTLDMLNDKLLRDALRGQIRTGDIVARINSKMAKEWELDSSKYSARRHVAGLLRKPGSFPLTLTLQRETLMQPWNISLHTESRLDLNDNMFVKDGTNWARISQGLNKMRNVTTLCLGGNNIGREGSDIVASLLTRDDMLITTLYLGRNSLDDECMRILAEALRSNDRLSYLGLSDNEAITETGWGHAVNLMCDTSSAEGTFSSNHTLRIVPGDKVDTELARLIGINGELTRSISLGRQKVWKVHFDGRRFDLQELLQMDVRLMHRVLAWFARDDNCNSPRMRFEKLYRVVRSWNIPELFGFPSPERVRMGSRVADLESSVKRLRAEVEQLKAENKQLKHGQTAVGSCLKRKRE